MTLDELLADAEDYDKFGSNTVDDDEPVNRRYALRLAQGIMQTLTDVAPNGELQATIDRWASFAIIMTVAGNGPHQVVEGKNLSEHASDVVIERKADWDARAEQLREALRYLGTFTPFTRLAADALADEVDVLVKRKVIDPRSPAADALLDYRNPPSSPRSDRLAGLESERDELVKEYEAMNRLQQRDRQMIRALQELSEQRRRRIDELEVLVARAAR